MISFDTNLLLYQFQELSPHHVEASKFFGTIRTRADVGISEFVLTEFYNLIRNPAVMDDALDAIEAVTVVQRYRHHPTWALLGYPSGSRSIHDRMWKLANRKQLARRRLYDMRLAMTLLAFGVTDFATANVRDFEGLGFRRVWNPLEEDAA